MFATKWLVLSALTWQIFLRNCHIYLVWAECEHNKFVVKIFATKRLVLSALIQHDLRLSRLKLLQIFFHKFHIYMVWAECEHSECVGTMFATKWLVLSTPIWHVLRLSRLKLWKICSANNNLVFRLSLILL